MPERKARITQFDPEGSGFDEATARSSGMRRDEFGHLGSVTRVTPDQSEEFGVPPGSFLVLKGRQHPTFNLAVQAEEARGFIVVKRGGRYFSVQRRSQ